MPSLSVLGFQNSGFDVESQELEKEIHAPAFAVEMICGIKRYGKMTVLNDFNMHVEEGKIYGLLGASGCGKTTALSCVIGICKLDSGEVRIFGEKPGSPKSGVPGKRIGYMPQGIALNREFTMAEVLNYFGKIYGMTNELVEERRNFFIDFLNLEAVGSRLLSKLSEGQRRRVSFAVALLHQPEILILDEPTVGVDPLLRQRMWDHLCELTKNKMTTIIITTHHIEETTAASKIGLMRHGHLVVEESPATLLQSFNTTSMDDIVFQLCLRDEKTTNHAERQERDSIIRQLKGGNDRRGSGNVRVKSSREILCRQGSKKWREGLKTRSADRLVALFRKNLIVASRSIWFWLFLLLMPAINIYLICACLVYEPRNLNFGIVNHEVPSGQQCPEPDEETCIIANLSCRYIQTLGSSIVVPIEFDSEEAALRSVLNGNTYGYMSIPVNFTDNLFDRFSGNQIDGFANETIAGSQITLRLDMSSTVIGLRLQYFFYDAFRQFSRSLQVACGQNPDERDIPLVFDAPVYGTKDEHTNSFVVPGAAITFLSFLASLTCGLAFINEKNDGMLTRGRVGGVTYVEIMLSHLSIHFVVLLVQSLFAFLVMFLAFNIPQLGSNGLAYAIVVLNGVTGMSLGFIAASICDKERNAMLIAIGAIIPTLLISGTLSPFEVLPEFVKYIGYVYPGTLPGFALKGILLKGWGLGHFTVWMGFVTAFGWITVYWLLIFIYHSLNA